MEYEVYDSDEIEELLIASTEQLSLIQGLKLTVKNDFIPDPLKRMLASDDWPTAVHPNLIADKNSEEDKQLRSDNILSTVVTTSLTGKKFLDFGCGQGHTSYATVLQNPTISIGYDIVDNDWQHFPASPLVKLTNDMEVVRSHGPYDIILLYDVIDHIVNSDQLTILKIIKTLLSSNGKVYLRCHPWCSRHATHIYRTCNKAFAHIIFNNEQLTKMGHTGLPTTYITHPGMTYEGWIGNAGLNVEKKTLITRPIEQYFMQDILATRIKRHWSSSPISHLAAGAFPDYQLEMEFIDYVLS